MSSVPNKNMNSITTRLTAGRLGKALARLFFRGLFWLFLVPAAYLAVREHTAFGRLSVKTEREFTIVRDTAGEPEDLLYTARDGEAAEPLRIRLWSSLRIWLIVWGVLLGLQFIGILIAYQSEKRRVREILTPLYELAAQAEALSQMEFGEDKYRLIEDAVSHLGADDGARLKLGDSDLAGVEAAINNLLTRIRESNRQQARFVNDASHELRTPIAVISGYADILARWGKDDEKVLNESIAAIRTETQRMKHLVEQLLFLARGDAGRTQLQKEDVSLNALMREAYEESLMIDEAHVYRFTEAEPDVTVQADPGLLKQAVRILLDNAAKYTAAGDEILLRTGRDDNGRPFLQVQDTGIGMARADVEHMFERFYRADEARSVEGTGLGLSIAKWIVDKHGGHFEVLSREDLGTRIRIVL
ncbi:MAG: sensor histidine kinase [Lachnospiraceae bacterium]|nr:sensor histidine kinase [Lachnospiraceae bacterium]